MGKESDLTILLSSRQLQLIVYPSILREDFMPEKITTLSPLALNLGLNKVFEFQKN